MINRIRLQPLFSSDSNKTVGYEALFRKESDKDFPGAADILSVIAQNFDMQRDIYINMSVNDAKNSKFADEFIEVMQRVGISGDKIVLEVSESTNPACVSQAKKMLSRLRNYGIRIALDDFGMSYSSLNFLKEFPVDIVKIDQQFIQAAPYSKKARTLMKFAIDLSHELDCLVVAEGIETEESYQCAVDAGADICQGFFFADFAGYPSRFIQLSEFKHKANAGRAFVNRNFSHN